MKIQMAARVAVYMHRIWKYDPSGATRPVFHEYSRLFHRQPPTVLIPEHARRGCFCCSRTDGPDIFEVVSQEESAVLQLPGWEDMWDVEVCHAYAEQIVWGQVQYQGKDADAVEKERLNVELNEDYDLSNVNRWKGVRRWDILG